MGVYPPRPLKPGDKIDLWMGNVDDELNANKRENNCKF